MSYNHLSEVYDSCKTDFWIRNSQHYLEKFCFKNKSVLDIGCGTGLAISYLGLGVSNYLGIDSSMRMLKCAKKKFPEYTFLEQSVLEFKNYQKFDFVICAFDTLNHFIPKSDWESIVEISFLNLMDEGTFIFDIFTEYDLHNNWPNQLNITESNNWMYLQRSNYDLKNRLGVIDNTIFKKSQEGWTRFDEQIKKTTYPIHLVEDILHKVGFIKIETIDFKTGETATETTERVIFFCNK